MTAFLGGLAVAAIATVATFGVLAMLQAAGIGNAIDDLRGLAHRSAPAALLLTVAVARSRGFRHSQGFSLACCSSRAPPIPITAGLASSRSPQQC